MPATLEFSHASPRDHEQDLAPLVFFYGIGSARPQVTFIAPEALPQEERHLLAHDMDMTPRLRDFHGSPIDLEVHARQRIGDYLVRASVLLRRSDAKPVEFGAIGIHLEELPDLAREQVLEGRIPFGALLETHAVTHTSHPRGFFQIEVDARLAELLGATAGETHYGRCNELRLPSGKVLADVVEVLPRGQTHLR